MRLNELCSLNPLRIRVANLRRRRNIALQDAFCTYLFQPSFFDSSNIISYLSQNCKTFLKKAPKILIIALCGGIIDLLYCIICSKISKLGFIEGDAVPPAASFLQKARQKSLNNRFFIIIFVQGPPRARKGGARPAGAVPLFQKFFGELENPFFQERFSKNSSHNLTTR